MTTAGARAVEGVSAVWRPLALRVEPRVLLAAASARRARSAREWAACAGHVRRAMDAVSQEAEIGGGVVDIEPMTHARGGFFSCLTATGAERRFVKGVLTSSREVAFWMTWRDGHVRTEGAHYRLLPPDAVLCGRIVTLLFFPAIEGVESQRWRRRGLYRRQILRAARAVADLNSEHMLADDAPFRRSTLADVVPVPGRRAVERALGVGAEEAREIVRTLREIEGRWRGVAAKLDAAPRCLSHMDLGAGNVAVGQGRPVLLDFAHAGAAAVGADLHVLARYAAPDETGHDEIVRAYAEVFAGKGIDVDTSTIRRSLDTHFAARFRNLRYASARDLDVRGGNADGARAGFRS